MTDLTKSLQDYLSAMKSDYTQEHEPSWPARSGALEIVLRIVVSDIEVYADPKTVEAVARAFDVQTKTHRDAVA